MSESTPKRDGTARTASGPRIVDFSTHLSGPLASHYLVELGADVIKVENWLVGDGNRGVAPFIHDTGMIHVNCGPGTRSLGADPRSPAWPELVAACVRWADAVIVGARPSDAARRGLDFATLSSHGDLVYCSISGYGQKGPLSDRPAHGLQMDAYAGAIPVQWSDGQPHAVPSFRTYGTTAAGMFAAMGIWAALYRQAREGGSFFVETSCWGAALSWQWRDATTQANLGQPWTDYVDAGSRYAMYATADGRALLLCPLERRFWERFCDLAGLPERRAMGDWSLNGMDWGAGPGADDERTAIARQVALRTLEEWTEMLADAEIPFAPILTLGEAVSSEHARVNPVFGTTEVDGSTARYTRNAVRVGRDEADVLEDGHLPPPPAIGADSEELLTELGLGHLAHLAVGVGP